jgi:hypothetical protein
MTSVIKLWLKIVIQPNVNRPDKTVGLNLMESIIVRNCRRLHPTNPLADQLTLTT